MATPCPVPDSARAVGAVNKYFVEVAATRFGILHLSQRCKLLPSTDPNFHVLQQRGEKAGHALFRCKTCRKLFRSEAYLDRHILARHPRVRGEAESTSPPDSEDGGGGGGACLARFCTFLPCNTDVVSELRLRGPGDDGRAAVERECVSAVAECLGEEASMRDNHQSPADARDQALSLFTNTLCTLEPYSFRALEQDANNNKGSSWVWTMSTAMKVVAAFVSLLWTGIASWMRWVAEGAWPRALRDGGGVPSSSSRRQSAAAAVYLKRGARLARESWLGIRVAGALSSLRSRFASSSQRATRQVRPGESWTLSGDRATNVQVRADLL